MTEDTSDDRLVIDGPFTADKVAEEGCIVGFTGIGRTAILSSWWDSWLRAHDDKREKIVTDLAHEATGQTDDVVWINPLDAMSNAESPAGGDT